MAIKSRRILRFFEYTFLGLTVICLGHGSIEVLGFSLTRMNSASTEKISELTSTGRHFERVLIIVLENQNYGDATLDPYLNSLAKQGASFTNFHALFHPSYPNYLAMITGKEISTRGHKLINLNERTIADLLKLAGLTWKNYAEGYPGNCFKLPTSGLYARKHVPFMSFIPIQEHQCENITPATQLTQDLNAKTLPDYMFYSPDLNNDGHDTGLAYGSNWLKGFLEPLRKNEAFMKRTLIIVTFDESRNDSNNHIYTVFLGDMVKPGEYNDKYNHYSVLRTIEENFRLGTLADGDGGAKPITDVWN
jgi:phosphoesterase family protein